MYIERKMLNGLCSAILGLVCLALMGTPCYNYSGSIGSRGYYTLFDFQALHNVSLAAMGIVLLSVICIIVLFNVVAMFIKNLDHKIQGFINFGVWIVALAFAIACMCSKRFNIAIVATNALTFIMLATLVGIGISLFITLKPEKE